MNTAVMNFVVTVRGKQNSIVSLRAFDSLLKLTQATSLWSGYGFFVYPLVSKQMISAIKEAVLPCFSPPVRILGSVPSLTQIFTSYRVRQFYDTMLT